MGREGSACSKHGALMDMDRRSCPTMFTESRSLPIPLIGVGTAHWFAPPLPPNRAGEPWDGDEPGAILRTVATGQANGLPWMPVPAAVHTRRSSLYTPIKRPMGLQRRPAGAVLPVALSRRGGSRTAPTITRDYRDSMQMIRHDDPFIPIFSSTATQGSGRVFCGNDGVMRK